MRPDVVFALAYLGGSLVGVLFGWMLPWWISGVAAYALGIAGYASTRWCDRRHAWAISHDAWLRPLPAQVFATRRHLREREALSCATLGSFFGALAGAACADASELLDLATWPGHEVDASILAVGVALAWLLGTVVSEDDHAFRPGRAGLGLYLVTVALAAFPAVWEAL